MISSCRREKYAMLDEATMTLVTQGFTDLKSTVTQVLAVSVPAIVGIICLSRGVNFALGKLSGVLGWA